MIDPRLLCSAAALCALFTLNAEAKLYKWVDENGTTHYGETIPPEYANKEAMKLEKGRLKKREDESKKGGKQEAAVDPAEEKARIEAKRRDNALLSTYANEGEIDLARNRNLLQVEARVNSYATMQTSAEAALADLQKERDLLVQQGKPIPASLNSDISDAEALVAKRKKEVEISKKEVEAVKARYEADKQRYRKLKGLSSDAD